MSWFKRRNKNYNEDVDYDDDDDDDEDPGVYRSYEDYLESGGPIDPCDDAVWLNDE